MTIEETIQKAIEGGYEKHNPCRGNMPTEKILLDIWFWKSLGKAMGWEKKIGEENHWRLKWHRFIDHLTEGKDIESFFNQFQSL